MNVLTDEEADELAFICDATGIGSFFGYATIGGMDAIAHMKSATVDRRERLLKKMELVKLDIDNFIHRIHKHRDHPLQLRYRAETADKVFDFINDMIGNDGQIKFDFLCYYQRYRNEARAVVTFFFSNDQKEREAICDDNNILYQVIYMNVINTQMKQFKIDDECPSFIMNRKKNEFMHDALNEWIKTDLSKDCAYIHVCFAEALLFLNLPPDTKIDKFTLKLILWAWGERAAISLVDHYFGIETIIRDSHCFSSVDIPIDRIRLITNNWIYPYIRANLKECERLMNTRMFSPAWIAAARNPAHLTSKWIPLIDAKNSIVDFLRERFRLKLQDSPTCLTMDRDKRVKWGFENLTFE
jgi:hypothetical protein